MIGGDPLTLSFTHPRTQGFRIVSADADCRAHFVNHDGWSRLELSSEGSGEFRWRVRFERRERVAFPVSSDEWKSENARVERLPGGAVRASWPDCYFNNAGYLLSLDGEPIGVTPVNHAVLRAGGRKLTIRPVWHDGMASPKAAEIDLSAVF